MSGGQICYVRGWLYFLKIGGGGIRIKIEVKNMPQYSKTPPDPEKGGKDPTFVRILIQKNIQILNAPPPR